MTMPCERTRAVQYARDFLRDLMNPRKTPRVPKTVREQARRVLRHFPFDLDLDQAAKGAPDTFGKTTPTEAQKERDAEWDKIRKEVRERCSKRQKKP